MSDSCGEFGHDSEDCPYGDPQYEETWNQGLVGDTAEWFWARDQTQPTPKREGPEQLQPKLAPAEEECLLAPPQPTGEISWKAFLCAVEASCWCPICGERGHTPLNCPSYQRGACCTQSHQQRKNAWWSHLQRPEQSSRSCLCLHRSHQQRESACCSHLHHSQQRV
ncbi:UNVERIFIED_CONTAM: hypothetical protein FKN15_070562 [Acipenser sinensis]